MKKLVLSAAVAAAAIAGQAQAAVTAVPLTAAGTPDWTKIAAADYHETHIAGSSAATPFLEEALRSECSGNIYKYSAGGSLAYLCSNAGTVAGITNKYLLVHKRDGGGSINGVNAAKGTTQQFLDVATLGSVTNCGTPALSVSSCTGGTVALSATKLPSELNYADVDPAQFDYALNGGAPGTSTGVASTSVATQVFGVVVNLKLRDAMQNAAITAGVLPASCVSATGVHSESEACMPNLTTAQISTIFANNGFSDWSNVAASATSNATNAYLYDFGNAAAPGNSNVHICTRTAGSGTLASFNIKFENAPCFGSSEAYQTPTVATIGKETSGAGTGTEKIVHSNSGSGDVEACLTALDSGTANGTFTPYPAMNNINNANNYRYAIGIMGVERNGTGAKPYRFIKIDDVAPSNHNVAEGRYKYWAELVQLGAQPTDALAIQINKDLKDPAKIATLNVTQTWGGNAGFLGIATNPDTTALPTSYTSVNATGLLNGAYDATRPVNNYTHATSTGANLNHCRMPTIPAGSTVVMPAFYPVY